MNPYPQLFENVRPTLRGADVFAFEWFVRTARLACDAQDWPTAVDRAMRLSDFVRDDVVASAAVAGIYLCAAADGNLVGRVSAARSLLPTHSHTAVEILRPALSHLLESPNRAADRALEAVAAALPLPQVIAVLAQRREGQGAWQQAFESWTQVEEDSDAARLRAGAAAFRAGRPAEGRRRLRGADIPPTDLVWVALAQACSAGFYDRLRGYDLLRDALDGERRALPGARPPMAALRDAVLAVVANLPPAINDSELERLDELVSQALDAAPRQAATEALQRAHAAHRAQGPDAAKALEILHAMTHPETGEIGAFLERVRHGHVASDEVLSYMEAHSPQELWAFWWHVPVEFHSAFDGAFAVWLTRVQRPSTGWTSVARALLARRLTAFARQAAELAYHHEEWVDRAAVEPVLDHLIYQLCDGDDDDALHTWLVRAKEYYGA